MWALCTPVLQVDESRAAIYSEVREPDTEIVGVNQPMALCDDLEAKHRQAEADSEKLINAAVQLVLDTVNEVSGRPLSSSGNV
jgi:hypothetical protein